MSVEEQEDEIRELEEESRRLRGVEEGIRKAAGKRLEGVLGKGEGGGRGGDDGAMET